MACYLKQQNDVELNSENRKLPNEDKDDFEYIGAVCKTDNNYNLVPIKPNIYNHNWNQINQLDCVLACLADDNCDGFLWLFTGSCITYVKPGDSVLNNLSVEYDDLVKKKNNKVILSDSYPEAKCCWKTKITKSQKKKDIPQSNVDLGVEAPPGETVKPRSMVIFFGYELEKNFRYYKYHDSLKNKPENKKIGDINIGLLQIDYSIYSNVCMIYSGESSFDVRIQKILEDKYVNGPKFGFINSNTSFEGLVHIMVGKKETKIIDCLNYKKEVFSLTILLTGHGSEYGGFLWDKRGYSDDVYTFESMASKMVGLYKSIHVLIATNHCFSGKIVFADYDIRQDFILIQSACERKPSVYKPWYNDFGAIISLLSKTIVRNPLKMNQKQKNIKTFYDYAKHGYLNYFSKKCVKYCNNIHIYSSECMKPGSKDLATFGLEMKKVKWWGEPKEIKSDVSTQSKKKTQSNKEIVEKLIDINDDN